MKDDTAPIVHLNTRACFTTTLYIHDMKATNLHDSTREEKSVLTLTAGLKGAGRKTTTEGRGRGPRGVSLGQAWHGR